MRFLNLCLLVFIFCGVGFYAVYPHGDHSDASDDHTLFYKGSDAPWQAELQAFRKFLKTDTAAARSELQNFAKKIFEEHVLIEEWVPLYLSVEI